MADRLAVMSEGRLEQIGTPREIFDRPKTDFVASFIGAGSFLTGTVVAPGRAEIPGLGFLHFSGAVPVGQKARFLVRPHRFLLGDGVNAFSGIVEHVTYRGQMLTLGVRAGDHRLQADLPTHAAALPAKGERVTLSVAPEDVTLIGEAA
jgi:putative spermidine/putrescine transport system ATP-binding protein